MNIHKLLILTALAIHWRSEAHEALTLGGTPATQTLKGESENIGSHFLAAQHSNLTQSFDRLSSAITSGQCQIFQENGEKNNINTGTKALHNDSLANSLADAISEKKNSEAEEVSTTHGVSHEMQSERRHSSSPQAVLGQLLASAQFPLDRKQDEGTLQADLSHKSTFDVFFDLLEGEQNDLDVSPVGNSIHRKKKRNHS